MRKVSMLKQSIVEFYVYNYDGGFVYHFINKGKLFQIILLGKSKFKGKFEFQLTNLKIRQEGKKKNKGSAIEIDLVKGQEATHYLDIDEQFKEYGYQYSYSYMFE